MTSKFFLSASIILLISTIFSLNHSIVTTRWHNPSNEDGRLRITQVIPIEAGGAAAFGPESFAFDPNGEGPYTGISDGRIIKWQESESRWIEFAVTTSPARNICKWSHDPEGTEHICGRPLGLQFSSRTGDLYIADAYIGLLVVGPSGGLATKVATQAQGVPFRFTNGVDIDQSNEIIYFTDSSSLYERRNHISVVISGDRTGRLMKYDPKSDEITVLLNNLSFPNGVALSQSGHFILVAETTNCRILKLWLEPPKRAGTVEVFSQLPGFPDNIKRNQKGEFWVGIHSRRGKFLEWVLLSHPWIGHGLTKLPIDITKLTSYVSKWIGHGLAVRLGEDGGILETLEDKSGKIWKCASEVEERNGYLWIGSVKMPFVVKQKVSINEHLRIQTLYKP